MQVLIYTHRIREYCSPGSQPSSIRKRQTQNPKISQHQQGSAGTTPSLPLWSYRLLSRKSYRFNSTSKMNSPYGFPVPNNTGSPRPLTSDDLLRMCKQANLPFPFNEVQYLVRSKAHRMVIPSILSEDEIASFDRFEAMARNVLGAFMPADDVLEAAGKTIMFEIYHEKISKECVDFFPARLTSIIEAAEKAIARPGSAERMKALLPPKFLKTPDTLQLLEKSLTSNSQKADKPRSIWSKKTDRMPPSYPTCTWKS